MKKMIKKALMVIVMFVRMFAGIMFGATGMASYLVVCVASLVIGVILLVADLLYGRLAWTDLSITTTRIIFKLFGIKHEDTADLFDE